jgi:hypothetical protein
MPERGFVFLRQSVQPLKVFAILRNEGSFVQQFASRATLIQDSLCRNKSEEELFADVDEFVERTGMEEQLGGGLLIFMAGSVDASDFRQAAASSVVERSRRLVPGCVEGQSRDLLFSCSTTNTA